MSEKLILESQVEKLVEQTYNADDEFCIDLDALFADETGEMIPIWQWAGYKTKQNAVVKTNKLEEGIDFLLMMNHKRTEGRGGNNKHQYLFTKDGFKHFLLMSNTNRGQQIRKYFIDVEKRFGLEIKESTPFDVVIQKVIGAFDQINHKLSQRETDQLITNQILHEHEERHNQSDERHDKTDIKFDLLEKKIKKFETRKDPRKADKDSCMKLIKGSYYNKSCPCCGEKTEVWEIDHFYDSSKNHITEIWPVCKPCNQDLGTGGDLKKESFRKEKELEFLLFQKLLKEQNKPRHIQEELSFE